MSVPILSRQAAVQRSAHLHQLLRDCSPEGSWREALARSMDRASMSDCHKALYELDHLRLLAPQDLGPTLRELGWRGQHPIRTQTLVGQMLDMLREHTSQFSRATSPIDGPDGPVPVDAWMLEHDCVHLTCLGGDVEWYAKDAFDGGRIAVAEMALRGTHNADSHFWLTAEQVLLTPAQVTAMAALLREQRAADHCGR